MSATRTLVEAVLSVAKERAEVLDRMRRALLRNDLDDVVACARILTGLEEPEEQEEARPS